MRILGILTAVLIGLLGLRLFLSGLQGFIYLFKTKNIPAKNRQTIFQDLMMGILLLILAGAILL